MKVAIVTHNVIKGDGQGRVAYETARYALAQNIAVTVLADQVEPELLAAGVEWVALHPRQQKINLFKVREMAALADRALAARAGQFDVVQGFGYSLSQPHQVNNVQFVHSAWAQSPVHTARLHRNLYGGYQWAYTTLNALWEQTAFKQARTLVPSSEKIQQELVAAGLTQKPMQVIHNGVDIHEFYPSSANRTSLGLPADVPLALFAGDIRTPRKNLDTVLRALAKIPDLHLAVVGAKERSPYPEMTRQLGVADRAHFLGFRKDVARIMQAADIFVFPSRYEACSLVLLEALASGLPVVTAKTAGGAELVTTDCGTVLADPNDALALAHAVQALLDTPQKRAEMGQAARAVAEQHTWERVAQAHLTLYQQMAA